nr:pilus (MSHA type) biogenesis protein MshL [Sulfurospirillum sp.]
GLITHGKATNNSNIPFLSSIPFLGNLFKYDGVKNTTNELVFVITPRIISSKDSNIETLKNLGFSKKIYEQ